MRPLTPIWIVLIAACAASPVATTAGPPETIPATTGTTITAPATAGTTTATAPPTSGPATGHGQMAVVGCSQTKDAITGYNDISDGDLFGPSQDFGYLGGGSIEKWTELDGQRWNHFERIHGPENQALWIMICWSDGVTPDGFDTSGMATIIDKAFEVIGHEVPVYVSGINDWEPREMCGRADYPASWELAEAVVGDGLATLGPNLGPLASEQTRDGCHGNEEGNAVMGEQLQAFFG